MAYLKGNNLPIEREKYECRAIRKQIVSAHTDEEWLELQQRCIEGIHRDFLELYYKYGKFVEGWLAEHKELLTQKEALEKESTLKTYYETESEFEKVYIEYPLGVSAYISLHPYESHGKVLEHKEKIIDLQQKVSEGKKIKRLIDYQNQHMYDYASTDLQHSHYQSIVVKYYNEKGVKVSGKAKVCTLYRYYASRFIDSSDYYCQIFKRAYDRMKNLPNFDSGDFVYSNKQPILTEFGEYTHNHIICIESTISNIELVKKAYLEYIEEHHDYPFSVYCECEYWDLNEVDSKDRADKLRKDGPESQKVYDEFRHYCETLQLDKAEALQEKAQQVSERYGWDAPELYLYAAQEEQEELKQKYVNAYQTYNLAEIKRLDGITEDADCDFATVPEIREAKAQMEQKYETCGVLATTEIFTVNYDPPQIESDDNVYPVIKTPKLGIKIFPHRKCRKNLRVGATEENFYALAKRLLPKEIVCDDVALHFYSGADAFEPDLAIISDKKAHLRIDIEIDEPYSGWDHRPIHFIGCGDELRDNLFTSGGWCVIRFAEQQIAKCPYTCIKQIASFIRQADAEIDFDMKPILDGMRSETGNSFKVERWTKDEAIKMAEREVRESYLGRHDFGYVEDKSRQAEEDQNSIESKLSSELMDSVINYLSQEKKAEPETTSSRGKRTKLSKAANKPKQTPIAESPLADENASKEPSIPEPSQPEFELERLFRLPKVAELKRPRLTSTEYARSLSKTKRHDGPYHSLKEAMLKYFPSLIDKRNDDIRQYQETLYDELYDYTHGQASDRIPSPAFELVLQYLSENNITLEMAGEMLNYRYDEVALCMRFGGISGNTLYEFQIAQRAVLGYDRGVGIAATLYDVQESHLRAEGTIKAEVLRLQKGIEVERIILVRIDLWLNKYFEKKLPKTLRLAQAIMTGRLIQWDL